VLRRVWALAAVAAAAASVAACGDDNGSAAGVAATVETDSSGLTVPWEEPEREPKPKRKPRPKPKPRPAAKAVAIQQGPGDRKRVALTFDADMTPGMLDQLRSGEVASWNDKALIRTLRETRTPATLFISGLWAETYPDAVRSFAKDSDLFEIASHTWDHLAWTHDCYDLPAIDGGPEAKRAEVRKTDRVLERLTGSKPYWFRFPGLCHNQEDLDIVASMGEQVVDGVGSGDAFQPDGGAIADTVLAELQPGAIIVMHMMGGPNAPGTADAVKRLIPALEERGYEPVTMSELFGKR
jgi:peptidoglycan/xylan/chitin deacetylase (PgdA/CDA1 family)